MGFNRVDCHIHLGLLHTRTSDTIYRGTWHYKITLVSVGCRGWNVTTFRRDGRTG